MQYNISPDPSLDQIHLFVGAAQCSSASTLMHVHRVCIGLFPLKVRIKQVWKCYLWLRAKFYPFAAAVVDPTDLTVLHMHIRPTCIYIPGSRHYSQVKSGS
jgi:hypothetical protein